MSIPVYTIQSDLGHAVRAPWLEKVGEQLGEELAEISLEEYLTAPFALLFVASGGSENAFLQFERRMGDKPVYLLTSGESNSLAASMEILSFLQRTGRRGEILHGRPEDVAERIRALRRVSLAKEKLRGSVLGCIGVPSDWLIASPMEDGACREKLDIRFESIPMEELLREYEKGGYEENGYTEDLLRHAFDRKETEKALRLYGALERVVKEHHLSGVSLRCFDLLDSIRTTGCLGLAILNAKGIPAACEGDMPALLSMTVMNAVTGTPGFMCNPSRIDSAAGEMILAHCTLPLDMPLSYSLMTHYESGIGAALRGKLPEGVCTLFKTDVHLDRFMVQRAVLLENPEEEHLCRTQVKLSAEDTEYFLKRPIGNHHILCPGDHRQALQDFFTE
ncbi:MAG: hypothetical protein CW338_00185 [Clostridiales bacterium]|nr:hypothetical protein [Clostridiales bacterium]